MRALIMPPAPRALLTGQVANYAEGTQFQPCCNKANVDCRCTDGDAGASGTLQVGSR